MSEQIITNQDLLQLQREMLPFLPQGIRDSWKKVKLNIQNVQEIRMRYGKPLIFVMGNQEIYLDCQGNRTYNIKNAYKISEKDLIEVLEYISDYSIYAYEEELRQGFLTIKGGHRVGIAGRVIVTDKNQIKGMKYITHINIRISHQMKGCANALLPWLFEKRQLCNTLLISGPGCGKTTMLRDIIRLVSDGSDSIPGYTVGLVDERSEIAGCYQGIPQNDVGMRTDTLDCCPKVEGMMILIRSMSPDVIAVDELGSKEDIQALETAINCGCKLLATVHGLSLDDIKNKPVFQQLVEKQLFERYVVLHRKPKVGRVQAIYDRSGRCIFGEDRC